MQRKESLSALRWLQTAEKDLKRIDLLLSVDDAEDAGFHLQQALEKLLKAFLLQHGWTLKRTHDLTLLLDAALEYGAEMQSYRDPLYTITGFYISDRYPFGLDVGPTVEDVTNALAKVSPLIEMIRRYVTEGTP